MRRAIWMMTLVLCACGERERTTGTPGTNRPRDAGPDSGVVDVGFAFDGGPGYDGGFSDSGPGADAFVADSGADSGLRDSGFADSGVVDSGAADSGFGPYCLKTCATPSDCVIPPGSGIADADNYACTGGSCVYLGCTSDNECATTFMMPYVCRTQRAALGPSCVKACSSANDCATAGVAIYDAAHYSCINGGCQWNGCAADSDCQMAFSNPQYRCEPQPLLGFDNCVLGCSTPSECVVAGAGPAFDLDNYSCSASLCVYDGCNSTAECQAQSGSDYHCGP